ncbi:histidine triad domain containing protein, partial [Acanthamoeba castellanii str. Neff]
EKVVAFLDINPLHPGHTLIVPKAHYASLDQLPAALAAACMEVAPAIGGALMKATGTQAFNIIQNNGKIAGQEVFHVHFHVVPRSAGDAMSGSWCKWRAQSLANRDAKMLLRSISEFLPATTQGTPSAQPSPPSQPPA